MGTAEGETGLGGAGFGAARARRYFAVHHVACHIIALVFNHSTGMVACSRLRKKKGSTERLFGKAKVIKRA